MIHVRVAAATMGGSQNFGRHHEDLHPPSAASILYEGPLLTVPHTRARLVGRTRRTTLTPASGVVPTKGRALVERAGPAVR